MEQVDQNAGRSKRKWVYVVGAVFGAIYGVLFRMASSGGFGNGTATMTFSFLALGSFCIGILSVYPGERWSRTNAWLWPVLPCGPIITACLLSVVFKLEGIICLIFAIPAALLCAAVGGVIGGLLARWQRVRTGTVACVVFLPLLLAPIETLMNPPVQTRMVSNEILIHAPADVVWRNVERVPAIAPSEIRTTWAQRIGFPKPVEATLSYEGVGGVRHASFERGLMFIETVTAWEPLHRLSFTIKADTADIPPTTLDEHVTIGGRYFDVLDGEYSLQPLPDGNTLLHLRSRQRVSTDFNAYAGMWSDAVMSTLQSSILEVVRNRCEKQAQSIATQ